MLCVFVLDRKLGLARLFKRYVFNYLQYIFWSWNSVHQYTKKGSPLPKGIQSRPNCLSWWLILPPLLPRGLPTTFTSFILLINHARYINLSQQNLLDGRVYNQMGSRIESEKGILCDGIKVRVKEESIFSPSNPRHPFTYIFFIIFQQRLGIFLSFSFIFFGILALWHA